MILGNNLQAKLYQLIQARLENLATDPAFAAGEAGRAFLNTGSAAVKVNNGVSIATLRDTSVALVNGDISASAAIGYTKLSLVGGVVNADISSTAAIALTKLASDPLARANHTGTQLAATISDIDTRVRTSRLDQMAAPTVAVALNAQKLTGVADPTVGQDAATKAYVDAAASGVSDAKDSVRAGSTANIASLSGTMTVDGIALANGDRVLVKDQTTASQNGVYVVGTPWTRSLDTNTWTEVVGAFVFVESGTVNADNGFLSTGDPGGTLDTTAIPWVQFSGAGQVNAGAALTKTGNTLDVAVDNVGIEITTDALNLKNLGVTNAKIAASTIDLTTKVTGSLPLANGGTGGTTAATARTNIGALGGYTNGAVHAAGATITITAATHGLGTGRAKIVSVIEESTGNEIEADKTVAANGDVVVTFGVSQTLNTMRVNIFGI